MRKLIKYNVIFFGLDKGTAVVKENDTCYIQNSKQNFENKLTILETLDKIQL